MSSAHSSRVRRTVRDGFSDPWWPVTTALSATDHASAPPTRWKELDDVRWEAHPAPACDVTPRLEYRTIHGYRRAYR